MEFAFFRGLPGNLSRLDILVQLVFGVDFVLHFFVAYEDEKTYQMIYQLTPIALRYLKSNFFVDLLAWMPWDVIYKNCGHKEIVRILLWTRIFRVKWVIFFFRSLEEGIRVNFIIARIVRFLAVVLFYTHASACILLYLATTTTIAESTWIGSLQLGDYFFSKFTQMDLWQKYTTAMYFSISTVTSVGFGDFHAANVGDMIFLIPFVLFNLCVGAYLTLNLSGLVVNKSKTENFRKKMKALEKYMNQNKLDMDIRERLIGHVCLQFERSNTDAFDAALLQDLPTSIRSKIFQEMYLPYVQNVSLFKGCSSGFLNQIVTKLHEVFYLPGEVIMEKGNVVDQLYFVCDGLLEKVTTAEDGSEETISVLQLNCTFGEICMFCNITVPYTH